MKHLIPLIGATLLLWSCRNTDDPTPEDHTAERTVLVYMAAENDLDSFADSDLAEMMTGSKQLSNRQNLVVYVDKAGTVPPFMARIKDGVFVDSLSMDESLSSDPAVLENVLQLMKEDFPAKSYGLVLWGHASGWLINADSVAYASSRAYGGDTGTGSSSPYAHKTWMNIPPMGRAIRRAMGGTKLKFICGDCCSLGAVEIAYELRNETEYFIGSPAEIPDNGAPYELLVPDMFNQNEDFCRQIISDYYDYYIDMYRKMPNLYYNLTPGDLDGYSVPLSVVRTSALEDLAYATASLLNTIGDKLSPEGELDMEHVTYGGYYGNRYAYDMVQVLKRNCQEEHFATWLTAYEAAVPYRKFSAHWFTGFSAIRNDMRNFDADESDCGSLSMFFPRTTYKSTSPNWNEAISQFQWNDVIRWQQFGW